MIVARYFEAGAGVIVLEAFALTAIVFVSITLFILVTKFDFHFLGGFLFAALIILICAALANFVFGFVGARSKAFTFVISVLGALVFTGYLLYDTSLVVSVSLCCFVVVGFGLRCQKEQRRRRSADSTYTAVCCNQFVACDLRIVHGCHSLNPLYRRFGRLSSNVWDQINGSKQQSPCVRCRFIFAGWTAVLWKQALRMPSVFR